MSRQQESIYNDRKLKPIYDYLDNGYFKKALQEIDKLLKKAKDWQYLRVLKALTFIRMNRQKDGSEILNEVYLEIPTDESTLQTMTICYRELQQNDKCVIIYENALKKDPSNEKMFAHLFMAYVRIQDYQKQQRTALNLYRSHPKNPYYFWAVMSIYMQANTAKEGTKEDTIATKITLPLAEKMCQKFYNDNKFEADQELDLYLMILEKQQKYSEMIQLIDAPEGKYKMNDTLGFVALRKVDLLKKEERFMEAFNCLIELVKVNVDQYKYYIELYNFAELIDDKVESNFEYTIQLFNLIDDLCNLKQVPNSVSNSSETNSSNVVKSRCRGPLMAKIIISHRIQQNVKQGLHQQDKLVKKIDYLQNDELIIDLIYDFFEQFSAKYATVNDITYLLNNLKLSQEQIQKLLVKIKLSLLSLDQENSLDEVYKSLCHHYLVHYNDDLSANSEDKVPNLTVLFQLYKRTSELIKSIKTASEASGDKTKATGISGSFQPFDPVIYLMANKISAGTDIYYDSTYKFDLIALLEFALANNASDFYTKLLLVRLYNSLGAAATSHALYETLDIKLIQNDTLGHFFLPSFLTSGLFTLAQQFLNSSWKFYTYNFKEATDFIINFYKNGSFSKVEEINSFNYKLRNSLQYHLTFVERLFMNLLIECKNHLSFTHLSTDYTTHLVNGNFDIDWDKICDNRDLRLIRNNHYKLYPHIMENLSEKTRSDEILWLRYRVALLQALTVASYLSENIFTEPEKGLIDNGEVKKNDAIKECENLSLDSFAKLVQQLEERCTICQLAVANEPLKYCLEGPAPSRLISYFKNRQFQLPFTLLNYLLGVFKYCSRSDQDNNLLSLDLSDSLAEFANQMDHLQNSRSLENIRQTLENVTNWTETISICISLLDVAFNLIQKFAKSIRKTKKKKSSEGLHFQDWEQVIGTINERLSLFRSNIDDCLKRLVAFNEKSLDSMNGLVSSFQLGFVSQLEDMSAVESSIKTKLNLSFERSFSELIATLQTKQKYLSSLTFAN